MVRLKDRDAYYIDLHFTLYYEHLQVLYEHLRALIVIIKFNIFHFSLLSLYARRSTEMLVKCSYMQKFESTEQVISNALFLNITRQKVAANGSFEIPRFLLILGAIRDICFKRLKNQNFEMNRLVKSETLSCLDFENFHHTFINFI